MPSWCVELCCFFQPYPLKLPYLSLGHEFPPRYRRTSLLSSLLILFILNFPVQLGSFFGRFSRLPLGGHLLKSRTAHSPRDMIDPGFLLSCGAGVAPRIPCAVSRGVSLVTESPAAPAAVWSSSVHRYVAKAKTAKEPVKFLFPTIRTRYPPDVDSRRLKHILGSCLL